MKEAVETNEKFIWILQGSLHSDLFTLFLLFPLENIAISIGYKAEPFYNILKMNFSSKILSV